MSSIKNSASQPKYFGNAQGVPHNLCDPWCFILHSLTNISHGEGYLTRIFTYVKVCLQNCFCYLVEKRLRTTDIEYTVFSSTPRRTWRKRLVILLRLFHFHFIFWFSDCELSILFRMKKLQLMAQAWFEFVVCFWVNSFQNKQPFVNVWHHVW